MSDEPRKNKDKITVGEDLYGISVAELRGRITALKAEIVRIEAELTKKESERSAADSLFKA